MQVIQICYPTLAVASLYVIWHAYIQSRLSRLRLVHERVAFMVWVSAGHLSRQPEGKIYFCHKLP
jgi:hypothetical protein